jgi:osmotically-inducible protein OsmY
MKTDALLQQDVVAELQWEPGVHAARIGVEVRDGVVTLAGEVDTYAEKVLAEHAALRVAGVRALAVEMKVSITPFGKQSDHDIARSAGNILGWISFVPKDAVKVLVEDGWLTLSGEVDWQYQRQDAAASVRNLPGVTGVSNQIAIKPSLAKVVRSDIEAALNRRALGDASTIVVDVSGADVTLSGKVQSWAERDLASRSAWSASGVRNVIDKMTVVY